MGEESREVTETENGLIDAYLVDVDDLRKKVQELGQQLATADERNSLVRNIHASLKGHGANDDVIRAALDAQFGRPKSPRKPRSPNRTDKTPTEVEKKALDVMTKEGMSKRDIFTAAGLKKEDENGKDLLAGMQRMGWIENKGTKGKGASWVLTESGSALAG